MKRATQHVWNGQGLVPVNLTAAGAAYIKAIALLTPPSALSRGEALLIFHCGGLRSLENAWPVRR